MMLTWLRAVARWANGLFRKDEPSSVWAVDRDGRVRTDARPIVLRGSKTVGRG